MMWLRSKETLFCAQFSVGGILVYVLRGDYERSEIIGRRILLEWGMGLIDGLQSGWGRVDDERCMLA